MNHPSEGLMTLKVLLVSIFYEDTLVISFWIIESLWFDPISNIYFSFYNEPNFILILTFKEDQYTCQLLISSNCLN